MAELGQEERLQPSLLDRLRDDERGKTQESRDKRILSVRRLRESLKRDLAWLLNTGNLSDVQDLSDYPLVETSVLNYGMTDLTGVTASSTDAAVIERRLRKAILTYEPRILKNSLRVNIVTSDEMSPNAIVFEIKCDMWSKPVPERLYLKTEIDLETGGVHVEGSGAR